MLKIDVNSDVCYKSLIYKKVIWQSADEVDDICYEIDVRDILFDFEFLC